LRGGDLELARALRDLFLERALVARDFDCDSASRCVMWLNVCVRRPSSSDDPAGTYTSRRPRRPRVRRASAAAWGHELAREDQRGDDRDDDQQAHDADRAQHLLAELAALRFVLSPRRT
jgi:hypothetical protein